MAAANRFQELWHGGVEPALDEPGPAVAAFRTWTAQLMAGAEARLSPRAIDLRKLRLTEGYREALRQAPDEQAALFAIWDAAYRVLERLHWELAPPASIPAIPATAELRGGAAAVQNDETRAGTPGGGTHDPLAPPGA